MTRTGPRSEHVFAAAWASAYLREHGVSVAEIRANDVVIPAPETSASDLRLQYAAQPRRRHLLAKPFACVQKLRTWLTNRLFKPKHNETLRLPPPKTTWQFENVRDCVTIEARLSDGRSVSFNVPFVRREESMQLLTVSSAAIFGAFVMFIPGGGNLALLPGVLICAATAGRGYLTGDVARGNAGLRTAGKLLGLGVVDCVPFAATTTLGAMLLGAQTALERYRQGEGLIDTTAAEPVLRELVEGPRPQLLPALALQMERELALI